MAVEQQYLLYRSVTNGATRALNSTKQVPTSLRWPWPVNQRLNELLQGARSAGEPATRAEILAALVMDCPEDMERLARILQRYRRLRVPEADPLQDQGVRRRPGPVPRTSLS